jgi:hypothetical protein
MGETERIGKCNQNGYLFPPRYFDEFKECLSIKLYELFGINIPKVILSKQIASKNEILNFKSYKDEFGHLPTDLPEINEPRLQNVKIYQWI